MKQASPSTVPEALDALMYLESELRYYRDEIGLLQYAGADNIVANHFATVRDALRHPSVQRGDIEACGEELARQYGWWVDGTHRKNAEAILTKHFGDATVGQEERSNDQA